MKKPISDRIFSVEEYIQYEWKAERRHEFMNGLLFEKPEEKDLHNEITMAVLFELVKQLKEKKYEVYFIDLKVAIPDGKKYYYPDIFVTKEERSENNRYIKFHPEIIVEVVSKSTHITDYTDKYIDYTKIPSLKYYIIVEPETILITVCERSVINEWITHKYTQLNDVVQLQKMNVSFSLSDVYK